MYIFKALLLTTFFCGTKFFGVNEYFLLIKGISSLIVLGLTKISSKESFLYDELIIEVSAVSSNKILFFDSFSGIKASIVSRRSFYKH